MKWEIVFPDGTRQEVKPDRCIDFHLSRGECVDDFMHRLYKANLASSLADPAETMRKALAFERSIVAMAEPENANTTGFDSDYTAYDRGDLCSEIDRALGDLLERVIQRYMPQGLARDVRHQICGDLADIVIDYDKSQGSEK